MKERLEKESSRPGLPKLRKNDDIFNANGQSASFISPYLESMLLARRLKISLQQHLPDSEHQNHEMRDRMALIIVALIVAYGTLFSVRRQCRPRDRVSSGGLPSAAASAVAA